MSRTIDTVCHEHFMCVRCQDSTLIHMIPALPITDDDVNVFLRARTLLIQSLRDADVAQRKLGKAVRFYLETY